MNKAKFSLAVRKAVGFTVASVLMAAIANATTLDNKIAQGAHKIITGDFDGDQKADVLWQGRRESEHELNLSSTVNVQRWKDSFLGLDWNFASVNLIVGDFNGDAAGDVILQSQSPGLMTQVMHAEYDGKFGNPVQAIGDYHQGFRWDDKHHRLIVGDFNGDMKDDVFLQGTHNIYRHGLALASQQGTFDTIAYDFDNAHLNLDWSTQAHNIFAGDFDGNGQSELLFQPISMGYVSLIRSTKSFIDTVAQSYPNDHLGLSWLPKDHRVLIGDFNGDSKDDVFLLTTNNEQKSALIPSDGQGFPAITQEIAQIPNLANLKDVLVADFDADGIDDIVLMYNDGSLAALMAGAKRLAAIDTALKKLSLLNKKSALKNVLSVAPSLGLNTAITSSNSPSSLSAQKSGSIQPMMSLTQTTTSALQTATAVGRLAGEGGVSGSAASYTIPVAVPPGRNGMQPSVSLSYSSRAGNGVAGIGWSLNAGQSSVHRCPSTVAQDGFSRSVVFDNSDKLCLDGQRLVAVNGSYGMNGTVYRTEMESFTRVIQSGALDAASSKFTVEYADARKSYFDFKVIPQGLTVAVEWKMSRTEDASLNSIHYVYDSSAVVGETLLTEIKYTGVGATQGNRIVKFTYENRTDPSISYLSGGATRQTKRLSAISTELFIANATQQVRSYSLGYVQSNATGRSLLDWVQECSGSFCLPQTRFNWRHDPVKYVWENVGTNFGVNERRRVADVVPTADYNGDGVLDWRKHYTNAEGEITGTHGEYIANCIRELGRFEVTCFQPDFNRDGITDSVSTTGTTIQVEMSESPSTPNVVQWINTGITLNNNLRLGRDELRAIQDFNADGWPDLLVYHTNGGPATLAIYPHSKNVAAPYSATSKITAFTSATRLSMSGSSYVHTPTQNAQATNDIDGNGLPDFQVTVTVGPKGQEVITMEPSFTLYSSVSPAGVMSFSTSIPCNNCEASGVDPWAGAFNGAVNRIVNIYLDVNGDGLKDWITSGTNTEGGLFLALNKGTGFGFWHRIADHSSIPWRVHSINGGTDNEPDPTGYRYAKYDFAMRPMDVDGDGREELLMPLRRIVSACARVSGVDLSGRPVSSIKCDDQLYTRNRTAQDTFEPINSYETDDGVYEFEAWQFKLDINGTWSIVKTNPGLYGSASQSTVVDAFGKGLSDVMTTIGCRWAEPSDCDYRVSQSAGTIPAGMSTSDFTAGVYMNRNKGSAVGSESYHPTDILVSAVDGNTFTSEWTYSPLTTGKFNQECSAKFYEVDRSYTPGQDDSGKAGYLHFASSMYAVREFKQNDGVGGMMPTFFCYEGAVYNVEGRGFQGFRKVISATARTDSDLIKTTSWFDQKFPKAGMLSAQKVMTGTKVLSDASYTNRHVRPFEQLTWLPFVKESNVDKYDINGASLGSVGSSTSDPSVACGVSNSSTTTVTDSYQTHVSTQTKDVSQCSATWPTRWESETITKTLTVGAAVDTKTTKTTVNTWNTALRKPSKVTAGHVSASEQQLVTQTGFDAFGNVNSVQSYAANATTVIRASTMNWGTGGYFTEKVTDAIGQEMNMTYDPAHGQVLTVKDPFNNIVETRYDALGRANWTQQQGVVSTGTPIITTLEWASAAEKVAMPQAVMKTTVEQPGVRPTQTAWTDALNRPLRAQSQDPLIGTRYINQDTVYDRFGRTIEQSIPHFSTSTPSSCQKNQFGGFDVLDRPAWKKLPNDNGCQLTVAYTYNGLSTDVQVGPNALYKVQRVKNALGQWWQTTDQGSEGATGSAAVTTTFRYDANGNPISITRNGVANTALYNDIGQKTAMTDPERGTWSFEYSIWGELTKQTDGKNQVTAFSYDNIGRPLKRKEAPNTTATPSDVVTWTYNPVTGKTAKTLYSAVKSDSTGSVTKIFGYNGEGLVNSTSITLAPASETSRSFSLSQSYDGEDRPDVSSLPNARGTIKAKYNTQGFATHSEATVNGATVIPYQTLMTDAFGNSTSAKFGNGLYSSQTFSANTGRITGLCVNANSSCTPNSVGNVQGISYGEGTPWYDSYGNLTQQKNIIQNVTETFGYDRRMRLTQSHRVAVLGGGFSDFTQTNSYQYDALGNLVEKSDYAKVIEYTKANKPHQAHKAWADAAKTQLLAEYNYDANGNLTSSTGQAAQTRTSVYNHQMVPTSISRGSASALFAYDESNERYFEKHVSNGKTEKIYKLGKAFELKFTTEAGTTTEEEQHYLGSQVQLMYKKAQNGKAECYQWRYLHTDRLGSVETITNQNKAVIERHGFDPFGKPRTANWMTDSTRDGSTNTEKGLFSRVTTRGYTGHDHIDSVGVIHMNGRSYDPELGRFMGVDPFMQSPLNAQSLNPYSYIMNNPLAGTDPTGYVAKLDKETRDAKVDNVTADKKGNITVNATKADGTKVSVTVQNGAKAFTAQGAKVIAGALDGKSTGVGSLSSKPQIDSVSDKRSGDSPISGQNKVGAGNQENVPNAELTGREISALDRLEDSLSPNLQSTVSIDGGRATVSPVEVPGLSVAEYAAIIIAIRFKGGNAAVRIESHALSQDARAMQARAEGEMITARGASSVDNVIESASRPARAGSAESRALQALKKKVDRGDDAFQGLPKNQETANSLIRDILSTKDPLVRQKMREGQVIQDIYDTSTGRGVRTIDGAFDTFVNL